MKILRMKEKKGIFVRCGKCGLKAHVESSCFRNEFQKYIVKKCPQCNSVRHFNRITTEDGSVVIK